MLSVQPDVLTLQEHWLTPANLHKFDDEFPQYMCFGSSAIRSSVESGVLRGRPFGGVMALVNKRLQNYTELVCAADRYVIFTVADLSFISVYFPCAGTADRLFVCENIFSDLWSFLRKFSGHMVIIGGDCNVDLDASNQVSDSFNGFLLDNAFQRCDRLFASDSIPLCNFGDLGTYFNDITGHESTIDYFVTNDKCIVKNFEVLDRDVNYSDHRPIAIKCMCKIRQRGRHVDIDYSSNVDKMTVTQLRWDHADLQSYCSITGVNLQYVLDDIIQLEQTCTINSATIDDIYSRVLGILHLASDTVSLYQNVQKICINFGGMRV